MFKEVLYVYENANPSGGIGYVVTTFSKKPSLIELTSHYKDHGCWGNELVELQYRNLTMSELSKSFEKIFDYSWVPDIKVFVDDIVKSIMVDQNSVCMLIQQQEYAGDVVLSILTSSDSIWSLLDFHCQTD